MISGGKTFKLTQNETHEILLLVDVRAAEPHNDWRVRMTRLCGWQFCGYTTVSKLPEFILSKIMLHTFRLKLSRFVAETRNGKFSVS